MMLRSMKGVIMTRGSAYCFYTKDNEIWIVCSDEWNGGMSHKDLGGELFLKMQKVRTHEDFTFMLYEFNKENHNYTDFKIHAMPLNRYLERDEPIISDPLGGNSPVEIDLDVDYYRYWFSDYNYFVNLSNLPVKIHGEVKDVRSNSIMMPLDILVTNFTELILEGSRWLGVSFSP